MRPNTPHCHVASCCRALGSVFISACTHPEGGVSTGHPEGPFDPAACGLQDTHQPQGQTCQRLRCVAFDTEFPFGFDGHQVAPTSPRFGSDMRWSLPTSKSSFSMTTETFCLRGEITLVSIQHIPSFALRTIQHDNSQADHTHSPCL